MLYYILLFTFLASIISLLLVAILLLHKTFIHKISFFLVSFAAFFLIERMFLSLHHHEEHGESLRLPTPLLFFGDAMHNFIDGMSIAAAFLVSFPLGFVTSLAVFVHEIPHELGDFGILIRKGFGRKKVLEFNILTAAFAFYLGSQFKNIIPFLLAVTSGNFVYLAATDLLPEIHQKMDKKEAAFHTAFFSPVFFL
ncbi:MAG: ZIP family metal transporter [Candidatus Levyibacteriota bacterium]